MPKITIEIKNKKLFELLRLHKDRVEGWKNYLILCMIRDQKQRLNLPEGELAKQKRREIIRLLR